jgi:hypothetical protein
MCGFMVGGEGASGGGGGGDGDGEVEGADGMAMRSRYVSRVQTSREMPRTYIVGAHDDPKYESSSPVNVSGT